MGTSGIEQRNGTCYTEKECKQRNGVGVGAAFDVLVGDDDKEVLVFDDDDVTQRRGNGVGVGEYHFPTNL